VPNIEGPPLAATGALCCGNTPQGCCRLAAIHTSTSIPRLLLKGGSAARLDLLHINQQPRTPQPVRHPLTHAHQQVLLAYGQPTTKHSTHATHNRSLCAASHLARRNPCCQPLTPAARDSGPWPPDMARKSLLLVAPTHRLCVSVPQQQQGLVMANQLTPASHRHIRRPSATLWVV
jgi:hypothetical protein